jgi:2-dehydro-3-deoxyphosphogluconate aldolase/(4S)-4-hydroxy-2-oxoglutarate aldolase
MITGALTPTEIMTAWKAESDFVKIFPCGNLGGPSYIRALRGPFPYIPMIPTGGVNLQSAGEFIRAGAVALGIGGELVSAAALGRGDMRAITETARKYAAIVRESRTTV